VKRLSIVFMLFAIAVGGVSAQKAQTGFYLDQNVQASYDPLGLQFVTRFYYRIPLVKKEGILWESTKIDVGVQNNLSPAYDMIGGYVDIAPIAVFDVAFTAQAIVFYDFLGFGFYTLSGYSAPFDSAALDALTATNTAGYSVSATPTVKIAAGPIVAVDSFSMTFFSVDNGTGFFYERINNCVLAKQDTELVNQAYLLASVTSGVLVGLNDTYLLVPGSGYVSHRLAAMGIYTTRVSPRLSLNALVQVGTYFLDRYYQYIVYVAGQVGITLKL
jgi:hypothetical protein